MQRNILIENGVLKSYMCDRYYGKLLGMESTGAEEDKIIHMRQYQE